MTCPVDPPAWHVDPVDSGDDQRIREIMHKRSMETGEHQTKAGTIRRAIRHLWGREVRGDDQLGNG